MIIIAAIVFAFGLIIGSFLNVCIYRIPRGESIAFPPSHCTNCGERLKPYDLVPVISYIILKGKCRNCGSSISKIYPAIELLNGILYVLLFMQYGMSAEFIKFSAFASIMIVIGMIDLNTMEVYFNVTVFALITAGIFLLNGYLHHIGITSYILGALLGIGLIGAIVILTKGMGEGDIEIALTIGLFLGFRNTILALFLSFIIGGMIAAFLLISKKKSRKDPIAFGPFMAASSIAAALYGSSIISCYIKMVVFNQ